ncbi:unnamed protein product [Arctia plantaginis]|uniref:DNA polymerase subunit gamma-2, mitochondrial n=1 Tax=Arctia plantaginis TaxID=874455 RepID=A0A8S1ATR9_ARCPL|nr:unnamed protein product [Arctia plantaginis]
MNALRRNLNSKVPLTPVSTLENENYGPAKVDRNTISLLERLSLVKYDTPEGVKILEDSITFANKILHINTTGVEPLYSVLEDKNLTLREDKITQGNCQKDILKNAVDPQDFKEDFFFKYNFMDEHISKLSKSNLQFYLMVPQQDAMQYFIKWQRYRKYWWSSISTTPGLFSINDIKYEEKSANVDIVAKLPCGDQAVENVAIIFKKNEKSSCLCCSMSLENALYILLLDGMNNNSGDQYLRLHRKTAPFKISFALDCNGPDSRDMLKELATLLHHKLKSNRISAWLPDFTLSHEPQIKDNMHLGVIYTAILCEETLKNGIFRLMSSSTMLGEQVHVADFHKYAAILFEK